VTSLEWQAFACTISHAVIRAQTIPTSNTFTAKAWAFLMPKPVVLNRGYQTPKQGVRSTNIFKHTHPENFKDVLSIVVNAANFVSS